MSCDKKARMIQKRESGLPTIPVSTDPRYGDWLDTDIAEGELYQDTDTGKWYSRNGTTITNVDGVAAPKRYFATTSQTGTSAPTVVIHQDDFNGDIVPNYQGVGNFWFQAPVSTFPTNGKTNVQIGTGKNATEVIQAFVAGSDVVQVRTYLGGVTTNGLLSNTSIDILVYP